MFPPTTKILIVDDMLTMRKLIKKAMSVSGYTNITEAVDGEDAWTKLTEASTKFQLVISDWNMPNCQGIDLLKRVRADENLKDLPFILLTAEGEQSQIADAVQSGVDNYILKPFTAATLQKKLEMVYNKRKKAKAAAA